MCSSYTKKTNYLEESDKRDLALEELLNIDISSNENDKKYICDLNYEWCGGNSHVVIIGDILDGYRPGESDNNYKHPHFYPQIELKIIRFINAINDSASKTEGKIIKLLGNHEIMNTQNSTSYMFPSDLSQNNYYNKILRKNFFKVDNIGFNEYKKGGTGILIKINNFIFVHGGIVNQPYSWYNDINTIINKSDNQGHTIKNYLNTLNNDRNKANEHAVSPLWATFMSDPKLRKKRLESDFKDNTDTSHDFCEKVRKSFSV